MAKNEDKTMEKEPAEIEKPERVRFAYGGSSGYEIYMPGRGSKMFARGDVIELNPTDVQELRAILCIVKELNRRKTNAYIRVIDQKTGETERVERFTELDGSLKLIPEVLRKHHYTGEGGYTDEEKAAIRTLVPDFPLERRQRQVVMI